MCLPVAEGLRSTVSYRERERDRQTDRQTDKLNGGINCRDSLALQLFLRDVLSSDSSSSFTATAFALNMYR